MLLACFDIQKVRRLQPSEEVLLIGFDKAHLQKVAQTTEFSFCAHHFKNLSFLILFYLIS